MMASTEMLQLPSPVPYQETNTTNTPPDSPVGWPIVKLSNKQATEMAVAVATMKMVPRSSPPPSLAAETVTTTPGFPTSCPRCSTKSPTLVVGEFAQQFIEVEAITSKDAAPAKPITVQDLEYLFSKLLDKRAEDNSEVSDNSKLDSPDDSRSKEAAAPASLLAFKEVDEI